MHKHELAPQALIHLLYHVKSAMAMAPAPFNFSGSPQHGKTSNKIRIPTEGIPIRPAIQCCFLAAIAYTLPGLMHFERSPVALQESPISKAPLFFCLAGRQPQVMHNLPYYDLEEPTTSTLGVASTWSRKEVLLPACLRTHTGVKSNRTTPIPPGAHLLRLIPLPALVHP